MERGVPVRLANIVGSLAHIARSMGFEVECRPSAVVLEIDGEEFVVDWRETAGPVTARLLRSWLKSLHARKCALLTMGFYTRRAITELLADKRYRGNVLLFEVGVVDYLGARPRPRMLPSECEKLSEIVVMASREHGLEPQVYSCDYCSRPAKVACASCHSLLCSEHAVECSRCGDTLCHPGTKKSCYERHKCQR